MSFENGKQLLIPTGFLNCFVTRVANTEISYKCTAYYAAECDRGVRFDDPAIGIDWGLTSAPVLSEKDSVAPLLADLNNPFTYRTLDT